MFDPNAYLKALTAAAYQAGQSYANTLHHLTSISPNEDEADKARDYICDAAVRAVTSIPAFGTEAMAQGIYASVFSGFTDRRCELLASQMGDIPFEDAEAIYEVGQQIFASMSKPQGVDAGLSAPSPKVLVRSTMRRSMPPVTPRAPENG